MTLLGSSPVLDATERFRAQVARHTGLYFEDTKLGFLADVLGRRAAHAGIDSDVYLARCEAGFPAAELDALTAELTVGETYFFRNMDQFRAFTGAVLPERLQASPSRHLNILSAGCASGEEPYTLAMVAREAIAGAPWTMAIRAMDLNAAMIGKARQGRFTAWSLRETPEPMRERWFRPMGREVVLDDEIRAAVSFETGNLVRDDASLWQAGTYDAVFCRNVLMYLTPAQAQAAVARIARALVPGGYLFLGHAETLRNLSQDFHLRHTHGTFYYQRKEDGKEHPPALSSRSAAPFTPPSMAPAPDGTWMEAIRKAGERIELLTRVPAAAGAPPRWDAGRALDLLHRERFAEALELVRAAPHASACEPDVLLLNAVLLVHSGQLAQAEAVCRSLLAQDELNAPGHYVLALCREGAADYRGAAEHNQVATYLDPAFAMPRLHLGLLARRAGERDAARRELGHALVLLQREDASRLLLFGGGFGRDMLLALCRAELLACGGQP